MNNKYDIRAREINSLLCVGLDSDFAKLPERFKAMEFPQFEFNKWIIDQTHEYTASFKANCAFYEARGDAGIRELKMTIDYINQYHPTIFTILDAKRADIGNTNNGYVEFIFDWLGFDSFTVHPYLGHEAVEPILARADKTAIILCRTSNPGARDFQDLIVEASPIQSSGGVKKMVYEIVAEKVSKEWNKNNNCMLVVGATYPEEMKKIRGIVGEMTFLVPGIGAQGGRVEEVVKAGLNSKGLGLIIHSARSIIFADNPKQEAQKLCDEIRKYI